MTAQSDCSVRVISSWATDANGRVRRWTVRLVVVTTAMLIAIGVVVGTGSCTAGDRPNIVFIAIDDLRCELGCYGSPIAVTPNLDRLAQQGLRFSHAYCQEAICAPSRASLLTGARPDTTGITHNYVKIRALNPDIITLPQHFIANGYETVYFGKIFHQGDTDDQISWSRKPAYRKVNVPKPSFPRGYALPENQQIAQEKMKRMLAKYGQLARRGLGIGPAHECADVPDYAYADGYNTELAIATMKEMLAKGDKPFFLALGFHKPHLNWIAPKRYWDLYDQARIPLATQTTGPADGAAMGLHASFELRTRYGIPKSGPIDRELARTLKHAYLACVSYVDAQLGRVIHAVDEAGIRDKTIIVVWSDHGWHLGDMGIWGKATDYEIATRVPLMVWTPSMPDKNRGKVSAALVELVDIYPTLCELAGIEPPTHLEGRSFVPLLRAPNQPWKTAAFSQFPTPALREWAANPLSPAMRETFFGPLIREVEARIRAQQGRQWDRNLFENYLMGYAMRTARYRLVLWKDTRNQQAAPVFTELYDYATTSAETTSIAATHPELVAKLTAQFNDYQRRAQTQ